MIKKESVRKATRPLPHIRKGDSPSANLDVVSWMQMASLLAPLADQPLP